MASLSDRLKNRTAKIGVMGLGYVGLPLAMEFCRKGFRVTGFEASPERAAALRRGRSYVLDVSNDELRRVLKAGLLSPTLSFDGLRRQDVVFICVQTPLRKTGEPDLSHVASSAGEIAKRLPRGQLVILESTTFPGATQEMVLPILERSGRKLGRDFFLAFSPERVDPGNPAYRIANTPKVLGGADPSSARLAAEVYSEVVSEVVPVSSATAAETVKLLENSFRAVNIALVNEMAQICRKLGLDVWEIVGAAATKPFGFMPFYPGPGIGGHCIPKDPRLLTWKMRTLRYDPRLIDLASTINGEMPRYTVERVAALLNRDRKSLGGSGILALGVAYKADTSDVRDSPALDVLTLLAAAGARVSYHDPFVPSLKLGTKKLESARLSSAALRAADCVVVLTAHGSIDYTRVADSARRVFDARNALRGIDSPRVERL